MTSQKNRHALHVERLEDRTTPTVWGNPWPDPQHMTLSFAPDGTDIGGSAGACSLSSSRESTSRLADSRSSAAFQTWAALGNINLSLTSDGGDPLGTAGPVQGSPLYGDIRIGSRLLSDSELAVGTPFDQFGTWSGEVLFNSGYTFALTGQPGAYDLYTVALQEAGHVFGLSDNSNLASVMYSFYQECAGRLSAGDITALQQLYGVRTPDQFDQTQDQTTPCKPRPRFASSPTRPHCRESTRRLAAIRMSSPVTSRPQPTRITTGSPSRPVSVTSSSNSAPPA